METLAMIGASLATAGPAAAGTSAIPAGMATAGGMASGIGGAGAAGAGLGSTLASMGPIGSGIAGGMSALQNPALSKAFLMATPGAMGHDMTRMLSKPSDGGGGGLPAPPLSMATPMPKSVPPQLRPMQFGDRNAATLQMLAQLLAQR